MGNFKMKKIMTILEDEETIIQLEKILKYPIAKQKRILIWNLLPHQLTSCYKERCFDCSNNDKCDVNVTFKSVPNKEFINIIKKENNERK